MAVVQEIEAEERESIGNLERMKHSIHKHSSTPSVEKRPGDDLSDRKNTLKQL